MMASLGLIAIGFILGLIAMASLIMVVDNREWVRDLEKKHRIGKYVYTPKNDIKSPPPQGGSGVPDKNYPVINTNDWASNLSEKEYGEYERRFLS